MNKSELYAQFLAAAVVAVMSDLERKCINAGIYSPGELVQRADKTARKMVEYAEKYAAEQGE